MRIAILSDIHGNMAALEQVHHDWSSQRIDRIVSLGDNVGYGPEPEEVLRFLEKFEIPSIMGNHELGLVKPEFLQWFNAAARKSLLITHELLSSESLRKLPELQATLVLDAALFVHGCPPDSITTYIFQPSDLVLRQLMRQLSQRICFVGHTHDLELIGIDADLTRSPLGQGVHALDPKKRFVVNAGSVGQPRDRDNRAKYVIWDTEEATIEVRFVAYDITATATGIRRLGFPEINASRLG